MPRNRSNQQTWQQVGVQKITQKIAIVELLYASTREHAMMVSPDDPPFAFFAVLGIGGVRSGGLVSWVGAEEGGECAGVGESDE